MLRNPPTLKDTNSFIYSFYLLASWGLARCDVQFHDLPVPPVTPEAGG
jgi:hypothetical protein